MNTDVIVSDPAIMMGKPVISIFENGRGMSDDDVLKLSDIENKYL